jgi:hypothetical protein
MLWTVLACIRDGSEWGSFIHVRMQMGNHLHHMASCYKLLQNLLPPFLLQVFKASVEWTIRFMWWNGLLLHDRTPVTQKLLMTTRLACISNMVAWSQKSRSDEEPVLLNMPTISYAKTRSPRETHKSNALHTSWWDKPDTLHYSIKENLQNGITFKFQKTDD